VTAFYTINKKLFITTTILLGYEDIHMKKQTITKISAYMAGAAIAVLGVNTSALAGDLTPQDLMVKTIFDKSIIAGEVEHDANGNLVMDNSFSDGPHVNFKYSGTIVAPDVDKNTGELVDIGKPIGTIEGTASFPINFVYMSAGMNAVMNGQMTMDQLLSGFGGMPPVVKWTCAHCKMVVGDSTYVSIVDALDPSDPYGMNAKFNQSIAGGAAGALEAMRLDGRAFTGETPVSFDPATHTMTLSMAGCSAVVGVSGTNAGMIGTLCMNSTASFDVSGAVADQNFNLISTKITAKGSSNCTTVLHNPTM